MTFWGNIKAAISPWKERESAKLTWMAEDAAPFTIFGWHVLLPKTEKYGSETRFFEHHLNDCMEKSLKLKFGDRPSPWHVNAAFIVDLRWQIEELENRVKALEGMQWSKL